MQPHNNKYSTWRYKSITATCPWAHLVYKWQTSDANRFWGSSLLASHCVCWTAGALSLSVSCDMWHLKWGSEEAQLIRVTVGEAPLTTDHEAHHWPCTHTVFVCGCLYVCLRKKMCAAKSCSHVCTIDGFQMIISRLFKDRKWAGSPIYKLYFKSENFQTKSCPSLNTCRICYGFFSFLLITYLLNTTLHLRETFYQHACCKMLHCT